MQSRPVLPNRTRRGKDPDMAVKWFIKAARQGNKTAQHNLGLHYAAVEAAETAAATRAAKTESEQNS